ncbi:hypothetical protein [Salinispora fenicalii]|uniref:hypothetical protein n=1 Tax=Salinispora fenicalii TaxID=1137263 RepID=UPI0004AFD303|nr:hypothetical protein [Salinispora fenicalii]
MSRPSAFDFGLTSLASQFHQDWRCAGAAECLIDQSLFPGQDPWEVEALRRDASTMLAGLTASEIETLWAAGIDGGFKFGPDGDAPSGPEWLDIINERCHQWQERHGERPQPEADWESGVALADVVAKEITSLVASVPPKWNPGGVVTAALLRCHATCTPDLALRWAMSITRWHSRSLEASQYARLVRLGEALGYGEFVVAGLDGLVE